MLLKLCSNCNRRIPRDGLSKCDTCQKKSQAEEARHPTQGRKFYRTKEWKRFRSSYLRDNPWCVRCQEAGYMTRASVCDHVIPLRDDGAPLNPANIDALCVRHHNSKSAQERHARREGKQRNEDSQTIDRLNQLGKEPNEV